MPIELKPCPFCGLEAEILEGAPVPDGKFLLNHDTGCAANIARAFDSKEEALNVWNLRFNERETQQPVDISHDAEVCRMMRNAHARVIQGPTGEPSLKLDPYECYELYKIAYHALKSPKRESDALADVAAERQRQIEKEGWSIEHDNAHTKGDLAVAAACYALEAAGHISEQHITWRETYWKRAKELWPWDNEWWKPKNPRRDLVRAAALILAEIERLDRFTPKITQIEDQEGK